MAREKRERNGTLQLLDVLYNMVNEAWTVPMNDDKIILERDTVLDVIERINTTLPVDLVEARRIIRARDELLGSAKSDAVAIRQNAEETAKRMMDEQTVLRDAQKQADEIISNAENKALELRKAAQLYVKKIVDEAEEKLSQSMSALTRVGKAMTDGLDPEESREEPEEKPRRIQIEEHEQDEYFDDDYDYDSRYYSDSPDTESENPEDSFESSFVSIPI